MSTKTAAPTKAATTTEAPVRERVVALMTHQALMSAVETRPDLAAFLKGKSVSLRLLGTGAASTVKDAPQLAKKGTPKLDQQKDLDEDTYLIGFGIPVNLLCRVKQGIEIPVGKLTKSRNHYTNNGLLEADLKGFIKGMTDLGNVGLRAFAAQEAIIEGIEAAPIEDEQLTF